MAESHVVSALVSKRAEIAGLIARTEQQLGQFRADLVHLDATLRLFAPELEPKTIPAKRIRQADLWLEHGELPRRVLDALRRAGEPIHAPDVVRAVMIDKGLDQSFARVHASAHACRRSRRQGSRLSQRHPACRARANQGVPQPRRDARRRERLQRNSVLIRD